MCGLPCWGMRGWRYGWRLSGDDIAALRPPGIGQAVGITAVLGHDPGRPPGRRCGSGLCTGREKRRSQAAPCVEPVQTAGRVAGWASAVCPIRIRILLDAVRYVIRTGILRRYLAHRPGPPTTSPSPAGRRRAPSAGSTACWGDRCGNARAAQAEPSACISAPRASRPPPTSLRSVRARRREEVRRARAEQRRRHRAASCRPSWSPRSRQCAGLRGRPDPHREGGRRVLHRPQDLGRGRLSPAPCRDAVILGIGMHIVRRDSAAHLY